MMRALYSGVAGLKTHQTKMDVIGNNIANVNTVGFKASSVTFSDLLYQTTQSASGANASTGISGTNAKQIGLGSRVNSISTITTTGGTQTTDSALDCMINGDAYFIVKSGGQNYFTKAGSFFVDNAGTLCTASGAAVQGWQVNEKGTDIDRDMVSNLNVMSAENMTTPPEATTNTYVVGNIDSSDPALDPNDGAGASVAVNFYDKIGNSYTMKLSVKSACTRDTNGDPVLTNGSKTAEDGKYEVSVADIFDSEGESIFYNKNEDGTYTLKTQSDGTTPMSVTMDGVTYRFKYVKKDGTLADSDTDPDIDKTQKPQIAAASSGDANFKSNTFTPLSFSTATGAFATVNNVVDTNTTDKRESVSFQIADGLGTDSPFTNVDIDFSTLTQYAANGKCSLEGQRGKVDGSGEGMGRPMGEMTGLSIDQSGKIYGSYDNGTTRLLGQIAVTTFANATGLEAVGNSMFAETQNSGSFDGIGKDITETGGDLTTSALEMSNVDLSAQFTDMITTQRGFQANSRIITTSDSMLEELINLKR